MQAERLLSAEATVALAGVVAGDLLPKLPAERTLPAPRRILAIFLFFGVLSLLSSFGEGPARLASAAGGVVALSSLVVGAAGRSVVSLLQRGTGLVQPGAVPEPPTAAAAPLARNRSATVV